MKEKESANEVYLNDCHHQPDISSTVTTSTSTTVDTIPTSTMMVGTTTITEAEESNSAMKNQSTMKEQKEIGNLDGEVQDEEGSNADSIEAADGVFKKYSSIENHYQKKFMSKVISLIETAYKDYKFVATEKCHGANFQFIVHQKVETPGLIDQEDNLQFVTAKRTSLLDDNQTYFFPEACKEVVDRYKSCALKAFKMVKDLIIIGSQYKDVRDTDSCKGKILMDWVEVNQVSIFGELFGGLYEHPDVVDKKSQGITPIQKEVMYCPHFDFYAFDIYVRGKKLYKMNENQKKEPSVMNTSIYLTYSDACKVFEKCGFHIYSKPIKIGTLQECLDFDECFETTIPKTFFPHIPTLCEEKRKQNTAEGVVIKPYDAALFLFSQRLVIKKKEKKFSEVKHSSEMKKEKKNNAFKKDGFKTKEAEHLWNQLERYITNNRLSSVISKIGDLGKNEKMIGKVTGMFAKDALEEFQKDFHDEFGKILKEDKKRMTNVLQSYCHSLVLTRFTQNKK